MVQSVKTAKWIKSAVKKAFRSPSKDKSPQKEGTAEEVGFFIFQEASSVD